MGEFTEAAALGRLVHDFCWDYAPTHLTASEHTLRGYRTTLRLYMEHLALAGVTPPALAASDFCAPRIEGFLAWLAAERGNSPQTCNVRLSNIRAFCRYASRHDATFLHLEAEAASVPKRKAAKVKVKGLSRGAVSALAHAPDASTPQGRKDRALIVALYATACRISELLRLRVGDLHLDGDSPYALVTGKGGKKRVVYLPEKAVAHPRAHIREFIGESPDPELYVFWSREHAVGSRPITADAATKMLQRHARAALPACAELSGKITPHRLRHARATHWLEDGMSIAQVSLLLGHASIQTTMDYLDITLDSKADAMRSVPGMPEPAKRWKDPGAASLLAFCGLDAA